MRNNLVVQRAPKNDLPTWEGKRKKWSTDEAKPFLAQESANIAKVEIDKVLQISATDSLAKHSKSIRGIRLWSGRFGELIGKIAFHFGAGWEKVKKFLDKIKSKFQNMKKKLPKPGESKLGGWKKKVLGIILKGLVKGFGLVVNVVSRIFSTCIEAIISGAMSKFWKMIDDENNLTEKMDALLKPFKKAAEKVKDLAEKLEKEFSSLVKVFETFKTAVTEGKKITSFISDLEWPIRGIFQAISCGFPPGWGCLWGIVGQAAMSFVLWTVTKACAFQSMLNRMACKILETQLLHSLVNWIKGIIKTLGLTEIQKLGGSSCSFDKKLTCNLKNDPDCFDIPLGGAGKGGTPQPGGKTKDKSMKGGDKGKDKGEKKPPKSLKEARKAIDKEAKKSPLPCYEIIEGTQATWQHVQKFLDVAGANRLSRDVIRAIHFNNCSSVTGKYIISQMIADASNPPAPLPKSTPKAAACANCVSTSPKKKGGKGSSKKQSDNKKGASKGDQGPKLNDKGSSGGQGGGSSKRQGDSTQKPNREESKNKDDREQNNQQDKSEQKEENKKRESDSNQDQGNNSKSGSKGGIPPQSKPPEQGKTNKPESKGDSSKSDKSDTPPLEWTKEDQEWLDKQLKTPKSKDNKKPLSKADKMETAGGILMEMAKEARERGDHEVADELEKRAKELFDRSHQEHLRKDRQKKK